MTSTTDVPRKGDRVRVSWEDGPVARTAEFTVDQYREEPVTGGRYPEIAYKNFLGRGFFVIGKGYSVEILERAKTHIDTVPGMVLRSKRMGYVYTILPDGRYVGDNNGRGSVYDQEVWTKANFEVVFDPRNAEALPSPFGIKPGDQVKRVSEADGVTETVEFEVNHVDPTGMIAAKYGMYYSPVGFEVQNREVPTKLPVGTILRWRRWVEGLRLITEKGGYWLTGEGDPTVDDKSDYVKLVKDGFLEVIYLP